MAWPVYYRSGRGQEQGVNAYRTPVSAGRCVLDGVFGTEPCMPGSDCSLGGSGRGHAAAAFSRTKRAIIPNGTEVGQMRSCRPAPLRDEAPAVSAARKSGMLREAAKTSDTVAVGAARIAAMRRALQIAQAASDAAN